MELLDPGSESAAWADFELAVQDTRPVAGLTHLFYRYPARFSPAFARAAIEAFTRRGELVLDPFAGGGTTLVEARVLGRPAIGSDISQLAQFISKVKVTALSRGEIDALRNWMEHVRPFLNIQTPSLDPPRPLPANLATTSTWRIRKLLALAMECVDDLETARSRAFARCVVLKTAQWAMDGRMRIPTVAEFREELRANLELMLEGIERFTGAAHEASVQHSGEGPLRTWCLRTPAADLFRHRIWRQVPRPKLILTSPPYPGVHVLYHRWQILGRRETALPFWISNSLDGQGAAHYTLGDRQNEQGYFARALDAFKGLARLATKDTVLVQLVGFARPESQLPAYLHALVAAGFEEVDDGQPERLWRQVPNRKWHADQKGVTAGSREVVLIHRLR